MHISKKTSETSDSGSHARAKGRTASKPKVLSDDAKGKAAESIQNAIVDGIISTVTVNPAVLPDASSGAIMFDDGSRLDAGADGKANGSANASGEGKDENAAGKSGNSPANAGTEQVRSHLLFYKAIINDHEDGKKLSEYIDMVEKMNSEGTLAIKDPFDRSVALTFEIIIKNGLNPWDVDLAKFSSEYLGRVKKEKDFDLVAAGRILFMAWAILKLQSDAVLSKAQYKEAEPSTFDDRDADWLTNSSNDEFDFTTKLINSEDPLIREMVWRKGKRPVTLHELVGAFEQAKKEAELHKIATDARREFALKNKLIMGTRVQNMLHQDSMEDDMTVTWSRICKSSGSDIPLTNICEPTQADKISTFVSSLFLAYYRYGKIAMWQDQFPHGEIYIKNISHDKDLTITIQNDAQPEGKEPFAKELQKGQVLLEAAAKIEVNSNAKGKKA